MKSLYKLLFSFILLCAVHSEVVAQVKRANRPAKEPYASMSAADKQKVQKKLVASLRTDTDYIAMQKIVKGIADESIQRRAKGIKTGLDYNANTPEVKKRKADLLEAMSRNLKIAKKYPELDQLDSETRKAVFKQAVVKN